MGGVMARRRRADRWIVASSPNPQTIVTCQGEERDVGGFQLHYRAKRCNAG